MAYATLEVPHDVHVEDATDHTLTEWLESQGWNYLFIVTGNAPATTDLSVLTLVRRAEGVTEYLIQVRDEAVRGPLIMVPDFVELMDLLGRWTSVAQAVKTIRRR